MIGLPLSVVGGYLGAGKTTLINRLLASDHGLRLFILVNDFGAINIDSSLLRAESEDKIELTNGCVCCTMGMDLFQAIDDVLTRDPLPDHVIVEASGIADPASIANFAVAEPDLRYAGIVTVVDGEGFPQLMRDNRISAQLAGQVAVADLVMISKAPVDGGKMRALLDTLDARHVVASGDIGALTDFLFLETAAALPTSSLPQGHPDYDHWSLAPAPALSQVELRRRLSHLPNGLVRFKGIVPDPVSGSWEIHAVGNKTELRFHAEKLPAAVVAIGLENEMDPEMVKRWWQAGSTKE